MTTGKSRRLLRSTVRCCGEIRSAARRRRDAAEALEIALELAGRPIADLRGDLLDAEHGGLEQLLGCRDASAAKVSDEAGAGVVLQHPRDVEARQARVISDPPERQVRIAEVGVDEGDGAMQPDVDRGPARSEVIVNSEGPLEAPNRVRERAEPGVIGPACRGDREEARARGRGRSPTRSRRLGGPGDA